MPFQIDSFDAYLKAQKESQSNPELFWSGIAKHFERQKPFTEVLSGEMRDGIASSFDVIYIIFTPATEIIQTVIRNVLARSFIYHVLSNRKRHIVGTNVLKDLFNLFYYFITINPTMPSNSIFLCMVGV